jgi:hypothetical protein
MRAKSWLVGLFLAVAGGVLFAAPPVADAGPGGGAVRCVSKDGHYSRCLIPWRDAQLYKQESKGACIRGESWGVDRTGTLWVDRGCRGLFVEADRGGPGYGRPPGGGGWRPGPGRGPSPLQCDSNQKRYQLCRADIGRNDRVRIVRQMSDVRCTEGYSWGWNRDGVWVDRGCRGQFVIDRRW